VKRFLIAVAASLMLIATLAGPAAADTPGCSAFGAATVWAAQNLRPFGQVVSGIARGGPHGVSGLVADEHGQFCS